MAAKKSSSQANKFTFSWVKLLVGLSFALNLAFIVFLITLFKTTYFDGSLMSTVLSRNYDSQGCNINLPKSDQYDKICITAYTVDANNKVIAPEWLKGLTVPSSN